LQGFFVYTIDMNKKIWIVIAIVLVFIGGYLLFKKHIGTITTPSSEEIGINAGEVATAFTVPAGYKMTVFAKDVPSARVMIFDQKGRMLVSETGEGKVVVLEDKDNDDVAESSTVLLEDLKSPHGMVFDCQTGTCYLYIAQATELDRYKYDSETASVSEKTKLLSFEYSATDRHKTRSLEFFNDHILLISIGSTCNVCNEKGSQHGKIVMYDINDKSVQDFATGLRNAVYLTKSPVNGAVWITEMGRDGLGDNIPPDEIDMFNPSASSGTRNVPNFGWPLCYGKNIHDTDFDSKQYFQDPCAGATAPAVEIPAHSAPLGLAFIPEEGWDESMWYNLLVAYHGSWNRSELTGYKVVRMKLDAKGNYSGTEDFITGWLTKDGKKIGRPAGIVAMPGGTVYVSDDEAGIIYRVSRI
jgi:glucose/arabinose dehydrogenase